MKLQFYKNGDFAFTLDLIPNSSVEFPTGINVTETDTFQVIALPSEVTINTITRKLKDTDPGTETNDFSNDFDKLDFN